MSTQTKKQILLVDDEPDILEILKEEFALEGYEVQTASCGDEAAHMLTQDKYNLVISDFRMPKGNGMVVLNAVNSLPASERPKFFFITGQSDLNEEEAYEKGVNAFFRKPFDFSELLVRVQKELT